MPVLDLPPLHLPDAALYLASVMFYSRDLERQSKFLTILKNTAVSDFVGRHRLGVQEFLGNSGSVGPGRKEIISMVLDATAGPKFGDLTQAEIDDIFDKRGVERHWTAGILLFCVLCSSAFEETSSKASLENAVKAITTAGHSRQSVPGRSRSTVMKCWSDFAPSAHLSAATIFFPEVWEAAIRKRGMWLAKFLAISEALRAGGERHRTSRSNTTLLNQNETWKVPPEYALPAVTLHLRPLSEIEAALCPD
jgi:hypothetical protein